MESAGTTIAEHEANGLRDALASGDRAGARSAWQATWGAYLHLGAVYALFGDLNQEIDGMPNGVLAGLADPHFSGPHRLEMGLWSGAAPWSPPAGRGCARPKPPQSARDVAERADPTPGIRHTCARDSRGRPARSTERDTCARSGQGVLGTAAGLNATEGLPYPAAAVVRKGNTEAEVRSELGLLSSAIAQIHRHSEGWPALTQLSTDEHELLNGTLAGALTALELLPGTLETKTPAPIRTTPDTSSRRKSSQRVAEDGP